MVFQRIPELLFPQDKPLLQPLAQVDAETLPFWIEFFQIQGQQRTFCNAIDNFPFHDIGLL